MIRVEFNETTDEFIAYRGDDIGYGPTREAAILNLDRFSPALDAEDLDNAATEAADKIARRA